jgi:hypothetical protein
MNKKIFEIFKKEEYVCTIWSLHYLVGKKILKQKVYRNKIIGLIFMNLNALWYDLLLSDSYSVHYELKLKD